MVNLRKYPKEMNFRNYIPKVGRIVSKSNRRLRKKSERQVLRGLESARNIKNKGLIGTTEGRALIQSCAELSFSAVR